MPEGALEHDAVFRSRKLAGRLGGSVRFGAQELPAQGAERCRPFRVRSQRGEKARLQGHVRVQDEYRLVVVSPIAWFCAAAKPTLQNLQLT